MGNLSDIGSDRPVRFLTAEILPYTAFKVDYSGPGVFDGSEASHHLRKARCAKQGCFRLLFGDGGAVRHRNAMHPCSEHGGRRPFPEFP